MNVVRLALFAALFLTCAATAHPLDETRRIAVMSAFEPEWKALHALVARPVDRKINGTVFTTGTIEGKPVVLFMSGASMVNAAMHTQLALDRFRIDRIVFSGIAGGVDPARRIGDVVVPERWAQYLESIFARETPDGFRPERFHPDPHLENFGMMFPNTVRVGDGTADAEPRFWFEADRAMLDIAKKVAGQVALRACVAPLQCLDHKPEIVVGGAGVSGAAFVDNAAFREYTFRAFHAQLLDMESAAVAHVAFANRTPFIVFRSLSDLAGGDEGPNQMKIFMQLASQNSASLVRAFLKALP
jgi:adenosylhomocysteine nucleosidase